MPKNLTDVSTFTAPIVVPVGTDPRTAASVELAVQGVANRSLLHTNRTLDANSEFAYVDAAGTPITKTRRMRIPGNALVPRNGAALTTTTFPGRVELDTDSAFYEAPFALPAGVQIVAIRALVTPGAARAGANKMQFGAFSRPIEPFNTGGFGSSTSIGTAAADSGAAAFQVIAIASLTHDVAEPDVHWLFVQAGNTTSSAPDSVTMFEVEYTATGPRSY